jgi:hypothetical protein
MERGRFPDGDLGILIYASLFQKTDLKHLALA